MKKQYLLIDGITLGAKCLLHILEKDRLHSYVRVMNLKRKTLGLTYTEKKRLEKFEGEYNQFGK